MRLCDNVCQGQLGAELWRVVLNEQSLFGYARDNSVGRHDARQASLCHAIRYSLYQHLNIACVTIFC